MAGNVGAKEHGLDSPVLETPKGAIESNDGSKGGQGPGLESGEVRKTVSSNLSAVLACHNGALKSKKDLSGKILLKWELDKDGLVTQIAVDDASKMSSRDSEFETCLMDAIKPIKFPKSANGLPVVVRYPFVFTSN